MPQDSGNTPSRITAVDQLRGYAIFGMLLVNASGYFNLSIASESLGIPDQISHSRDYFTYADTIAPLFLFVAGMGMRLSWLNRSKKDGSRETRWAMAKRFTAGFRLGPLGTAQLSNMPSSSSRKS